MKVLKISGIILLVLLSIVSVCVLAAYIITKDVSLDIEKLETSQSRLLVTDCNGDQVRIANSKYTPISEISSELISTFVAVEDKRFYEHGGIDIVRMVKAGINNLMSFSFKEGASTISQQLIKNTHLSPDKTIKRKLSEIKLALELEKRYSKDEILEKYLNVIYFGSGIYGIHDACMSFFGKLPADINLSEACMIAGVVKNPAKNSPLINYNGAVKRQNVIFDLLEKQDNIDKIILNKARKYNIILNNKLKENNYQRNYTKNVLQQASTILSMSEKQILNSNYHIYTYLDDALQKSISQNIEMYDDMENINYNYLVTNNHTGGVRASLSNLGIADCNIKRQAGSVLKPFSVYLPAMIDGVINPLSSILDEKINIGGYEPKNYNNIYHGNVSVIDSIIHSYNIPAVKVLNEISVDTSTDFLAKLGIKVSDRDKNLSLALGTNSVSPTDIASCYLSLASDGMYKRVSYIEKICDESGNILFDNDSAQRVRVYEEDSAFIMKNILTKTSKYGTAKKLRSFDYDIASKTGTVAVNGENTDGWCASFTVDDTVTVWHGAKEGLTLSSRHMGGGYPTLVTADIYNMLYDSRYSSAFTPPDSVLLCKIDRETLENEGKILRLSNSSTRDGVYEYFPKGNLPACFPDPNEELKYTVTRFHNFNILQFDAVHGAKYKVYCEDISGKTLIREIVANGDIVRFADRHLGARYIIVRVE